MDILVEVHINNDFDSSGITCAKISLDDMAIKHIFRLARKAGNSQTIQEFDYTPELGKSDINFEQMEGTYWDIEKLKKSNPNYELEIFTPVEDVRMDCVQLNVDNDDFWWEGCFKNTDVHWTTRMIPLDFLPQELKPQSGKSQTAKPDLEMTTAELNAIHEKIAAGIAAGLNAREIDATFQRHVTKAQLVRVIMELIYRGV